MTRRVTPVAARLTTHRVLVQTVAMEKLRAALAAARRDAHQTLESALADVLRILDARRDPAVHGVHEMERALITEAAHAAFDETFGPAPEQRGRKRRGSEDRDIRYIEEAIIHDGMHWHTTGGPGREPVGAVKAADIVREELRSIPGLFSARRPPSAHAIAGRWSRRQRD